jgi:hypothetical protein
MEKSDFQDIDSFLPTDEPFVDDIDDENEF